jgi:predicted DNA-binding transcriptional regulator YafY
LKEIANEKWGREISGAGDEQTEIDIIYVPGTKRYRLNGACFFMLPMKLSEEEVYILSAGVKLCKHFIAAYANSADKLSKKLRESIPRQVMDKGEELSGALTMLMPVSDAEQYNRGVTKAVLDSIVGKRALLLQQYVDTKGSVSSETISPYLLYFKHHSWYVWARSSKYGRPGPYRLGRIKAARAMGQEQYIPPDRSKDEIISDLRHDCHPLNEHEWYDIKLRITGNYANSVRLTQWFSEDEHFAPQKDGSLIYTVKLKGLESIAMWVMRSLDCMEVLEPRELRDMIDERVAAYVERRGGAVNFTG